MNDEYDIIVIGSGLAGSATAMLLSRIGLRTLVVEKKTHPRFVIGESTVPTTTALLNFLSLEYDVPELAQIRHYLGLKATGCAGWPKQSFWYGVHEEGERLRPERELMLEAILLPNGPEVHMLRADVDAFLVSRLGAYGVDYVENTEVVGFRHDAGGARLRVSGPAGERELGARLVVDASGHASFLANRFGLRDEPPALQTNTRSIFGHFRQLEGLDEQLGPNPVFRFRRDSGTMHHCIPGGWIWVIPFDNGLVSIGFQLDRTQYPLDHRVSPEEEVQAILNRYPSIKEHLSPLVPVRPLIRADRIQFTSKTILGDGFILTPHAAAFIEPLFSTGIALTLAFCSRFVRAAQGAHANNDWSQERFRHLEGAFFQEVQQIDLLVDGCIRALRNHELFKQYWRAWIVATVAQYAGCVLARGAPSRAPILYGSSIPGFPEALRRIHQLVCQESGNDIALAREIGAAIEPWYQLVCEPAFTTVGEWSVSSPQGCCVIGASTLEMADQWLGKVLNAYAHLGPELSMESGRRYFVETAQRLREQRSAYLLSCEAGTDYRHSYDKILANASTFDYRDWLGLPAQPPK